MRQRDALSFSLLPFFLLLVIGLGPLLAASYGSFFQLSQKPIFHWLLRTLFFCGVLVVMSFLSCMLQMGLCMIILLTVRYVYDERWEIAIN
jgi:hypothetical protein